MGTATDRVDASAREGHFLDHLAPIWLAIPDHHRGTIYVGSDAIVDQARSMGLGPAVVGWPERGPKLGPVLVAAFGDLRVASRTRRRVILAEHGAGQSYSSRHRSYVGGVGREKVALFLVPNDHAAARNHRYYHAPNAVIGSPRVDDLAKIPAPTGPATVAISFHWRCEVAPETGSAIDDFAPELEEATRLLKVAGVDLIGHAHPRIAAEAAELYAAAGIEFVASFEDVVARAHVYAVDNSSTLFEFAALDRPVVVLNARAYRRSLTHGLRFWTEADVGLNAGPGELATNLLRALEDDPSVAASRRAAVARTYAVADGTSAHRAASAIVTLLSCPVCGDHQRKCGGPTEIIPVDEPKERPEMTGTLKRYPNPARPGSFLKLNETDARRMGLLGQELASPRRPGPTPDVTNLGGDELVSSTLPAPDVPKGALIPSGPTQRARAAAAETEADGTPPAEEGEEDDGTGAGEDDATAPGVEAPVTAPTSSRRRRVVDSPQA